MLKLRRFRECISLFLALFIFPMAAAYEEPVYELVHQATDYEIRVYESYLVAETSVTGGFDQSGNIAFRRLAGYIFGDNRRTTNAPTDKVQSVTMNMTAPVTRQRISDSDRDATLYRFVMEREFDLDSLPQPNNENVKLTEEAGGRFAVLRYRGRITEARFNSQVERLRASLARDGIESLGEPISAVYNSPFTPPFLRRNEVLLRIVPTIHLRRGSV